MKVGVTLGTVAVMAALAGGGSAAPADAAAKKATCDQAPGVTIASSARWRVFWPASETIDEGARGLPLYACHRGNQPVTRVRVLAYDDDAYGNEIVPMISGDIAQVDHPSRGHSDGRLIDLSRGLVAPGDVASGGTCQDDADRGVTTRLLPTGSVARVPFVGGCGYPVVDGALTLSDATGAHVVAPSATGLATSRGLDGRASGLYYEDPTGQPARVEGDGAATGVPWTSDPDLAWKKQSFPARKSSRMKDTHLTADGTASFAIRQRLTRAGKPQSLSLTASRRPRPYVGPGPVSVAALALHSQKQARVVASAGFFVLAVARFADAPQAPRLRLYRTATSNTAPLLDLPADALPTGPGRALVTERGSVVLASPDRVDTWSEGPGPDYRYVVRSTPAVNPGDLASPQLGPIYYSDATGVHVIAYTPAV